MPCSNFGLSSSFHINRILKVKKAPGSTSHAKEDNPVIAAPYDAPFNKNLDIVMNPIDVSKSGSDQKQQQDVSPIETTDKKLICSPSKSTQSVDGLSILIPSPSAVSGAPAYFPSPQAASANTSKYASAESSKKDQGINSNAATTSKIPTAAAQLQPSRSLSLVPPTNTNTLYLNKNGSKMQSPYSHHSGSGSPSTGRSPKHNPFGHISPKTNPFMSLGPPKDHFWESQEAEARVAAATEKAAGSSHINEGGSKTNSELTNTHGNETNSEVADAGTPPSLSSAFDKEKMKAGSHTHTQKHEKLGILEKLEEVVSPAPDSSAGAGVAEGAKKADNNSYKNPFLMSSHGLSLGFGNTLSSAGVFGSSSNALSTSFGGGGILSKLSTVPTAMFTSTTQSNSSGKGSPAAILSSSKSLSTRSGLESDGVHASSSKSSTRGDDDKKLNTDSCTSNDGDGDDTTAGGASDAGAVSGASNVNVIGSGAGDVISEEGGEDPEEDHSPRVYGKTYDFLGGPIVTGEEEEKVVVQHRCKLYRLTEQGSTKKKEWVEVGIGPLRVLSSKAKSSDFMRPTRIVMRREEKKGGSGTKLLLNLPIRAQCSVTQNSENTFVLSTVVAKQQDTSLGCDESKNNGTSGGNSNDSEGNVVQNCTETELVSRSYLVKCKLAKEIDEILRIVKASLDYQKLKIKDAE
eukprot:GSChrysophyteH1.ASY1.ANO1.1227.1 assembled CDS